MRIIDWADGFWMSCRGCERSEARYYEDQGRSVWVRAFCGLCDLERNAGQGKLRRELEGDDG